MTPAFEKAFAWVASLKGRSFVGTESRLHTVVELLRQIVHGTEVEPDVRLAELRRRRDEIDAEIAAVESGIVTVLDATGVRDRYQQLSATARDLLSDFREVEENFRLLDRADVKRIIERFRGRDSYAESDKNWMRRVTDVRNWFVFAASERDVDTGVEWEHCSDSDGKSGGQK